MSATGVRRRGRATHATIRQMAAEIGRRFHPLQVVLFGSYAYGKPTADSDVDLLVIADRRLDPSAIRCALPDAIPTDVIVRTRREIERGLAAGDPFLHEIVTKGRVVYEASRRRVG